MTVHAHRRRKLTAALVVLCAAILAPAAPARAQDEPPVITNARITPASLPSNGGTVTVTADVHDDISVFSVEADAYGPGFFTAPMLLTDGDAGTFTGTIDLPPNFAEDAVGYQIEVMAVDGTSATSSALVGDVEVRGNPPFDEKPMVWDASVTPTDLPVEGGPVSLAVSAWDLRGISEAYASIAGPGGPYQVPLEPVSADRFTATFDAPANDAIFPAPYEVSFVAMDDIGQQTVLGGERVTVAARPTGQLEIRPGDRDFGDAAPGTTAERQILLRNRGAQGTRSIGGLIQTSGAPFSLVGETAAGIAFDLQPGESKVYRLRFAPTALGRFDGQLNVVRTDYGQPGLHVLLTGRGAPPGPPADMSPPPEPERAPEPAAAAPGPATVPSAPAPQPAAAPFAFPAAPQPKRPASRRARRRAGRPAHEARRVGRSTYVAATAPSRR